MKSWGSSIFTPPQLLALTNESDVGTGGWADKKDGKWKLTDEDLDLGKPPRVKAGDSRKDDEKP